MYLIFTGLHRDLWKLSFSHGCITTWGLLLNYKDGGDREDTLRKKIHTCPSSDDVHNDHRCLQFLWGDDPGTDGKISLEKVLLIHLIVFCNPIPLIYEQGLMCFLIHEVNEIVTCVWISSLIDSLLSFFFFTARSSTRGLIVIPWRKKEKLSFKKHTACLF